MQYILTHEEYQALTKRAEQNTPNDKLLVECIKVATTTPVFYWGNTEARIWGCPQADTLLTGTNKELWETKGWDWEGAEGLEWSEYCDECIVQNICPADKLWSQ